MRYLIAVMLVVVVSSASFAAITAKAGLAGGAFRIGGEVDKQLNDKASIVGDLGYGIGNQYNVMTLGISGKYTVRPNIYAGIEASYSSYSETVRLSIGGDITQKAGVGFGVFAGTNLRENVFAQIGYDTRLGLVAEAGYLVRK